jgi:hypothetical protein
MNFLMLILSCLLGQSARAQWPVPVREKILALTPRYQALDSSGFATFWGGFQRWKQTTSTASTTRMWKTPLFRSGELPLYLSGRPQHAPLIVFMPGIFGETTRGLTPQTINMLEKLNAHLLVVPNIISTQYIAAHSLYGEDVVQTEVQVMESALDYALTQLGGRVGKIHVVAESLGTAVGSAWGAHDGSHQKRLSSLTLLHPPQSLPAAMRNFDAIIEEHRPFVGSCGKPRMLWNLFTGFVVRDVPQNLTEQDKRCFAAEALVNKFVGSAVRNYNAYAVSENKDRTFAPQDFTDLFSHYRPELWAMLQNNDPRLQLSHWVKRINENKRPTLRILTSQDDFLNRGLSWENFIRETGMASDDLLVLSWGGHSGPLGMTEMPEILKDLLASLP